MVTEAIVLAQNAIDKTTTLVATPNIIPNSDVARTLANAKALFGTSTGWLSGLSQPSIDNLDVVKGKPHPLSIDACILTVLIRHR